MIDRILAIVLCVALFLTAVSATKLTIDVQKALVSMRVLETDDLSQGELKDRTITLWGCTLGALSHLRLAAPSAMVFGLAAAILLLRQNRRIRQLEQGTVANQPVDGTA